MLKNFHWKHSDIQIIYIKGYKKVGETEFGVGPLPTLSSCFILQKSPNLTKSGNF